MFHDSNAVCRRVCSPALQLFYRPCHLVDFLLQASDGVSLLFGAGVCALRSKSGVSQLEM